ncbi:MAG: diguanylate cyclase/phosphodiesterase (GGDEF & EAL domains) with PAS/PAC sensor(s) [Rhodanobacteraceae bacterium]|jgi:diguanylate cyclase (GGDEF)-like protein|nr:MAG: diguanylate cyclase/phosphodiesterase (GGDEF & EAL domains) with PAS/PAC sensor(s) [Rhodanobacteraceae bacterium]
MAGNFLPAPASIIASPSLDAISLLEANGKLLAAADLDAVVAAARELLGGLAPGTEIRRCARGIGTPVTAGAFGRQLQISLSRREILLVTAPDDCGPLGLLKAAADLIEARIEALGKQIALAESIEHLGRSERLQRALYAIADQASSAGDDLATMFEKLHGIVSSLMYAENFYIALYDAARGSVRFAYYADVADPNIPDPHDDLAMAEILHGPTWYVLEQGKPLMGPPEAMSRCVAGPFHMVGAVCKDWLGVPLLRGTDVAGCVVVQSYDDAHHFSEQDKTLLIYVAQHIQTALERRLAHVELEHRVNERTAELQQQVLERQRGERLQAALFRIAEIASTTDSMETFYATVHHVVGDLLYARNFYIALASEDGTELTFPYLVDERDGEHPPRKGGNGLTEYVVRHGKALLADSAEIARLRAAGEVAQHGPESECWLGVPLVCAERTVGVLAVQSYSPERRYTQRDQELLTFVSYHIANALERIRAAESLRHAYADLERHVDERTGALALANRDLRAQIAERERVEQRLKHETLHDSLTGLPNRTQLTQRLARALARYRADPAAGFAVLFMDLDRFKVINDSVGHLVGDDLLFEVGKRIRACLKPMDVVARLGGDEFSVLLEGVADADTASQVAARIIHALNAPFWLASKEIFTSTSVGIALAAPHYQSPDELLRDADSAMYRAKAEGRHRCVVFDEDLRRQAVSLLEVENDLRRGLTRNEFVPHYQPIVNLDTGRVIGYEALMRWRHPRRGIVLPGEFLGVAEDTGMSEAIDWQIFTQACRDANALAGSGDAFVSINLSARHFRDPRLDQRLLGLLAEYAAPASRFRIEVTERALLEDTPTVKRVLQIFRHAGIGISLDDFGTGYSSLSYLHQYPLQMLKIDRSFVADLTKDDGGSGVAVIRAILAMADALSMQVIAEGVETTAQRDLLHDLGCHHVQGFLYSKAQPVDTWIGGDAPVFAA